MVEEIEFIYKEIITKIQCKGDEYMKDIISRYKIKSGNKDIYCMYDGNKIDENKKLNEIKKNNNIKILVVHWNVGEDYNIKLANNHYL